MAVLSILFEAEPGADNDAFAAWNVMNIPVQGTVAVSDFFDPNETFNIWKFFYTKERLK